MHRFLLTVGHAFAAAVAAVLIAGAGTSLHADESPAATTPTASARGVYTQASDFITQIIRDNLPDEYIDQRKWGMQKEVRRGVRFSGKLFELKMNSRRKTLNHGTWTMYEVRLKNPDELRVAVAHPRSQGGGRLGFDAIITARLDCVARLAEWRQGVQLIALSTDAEAAVRMRLSCAVGIKIDTKDSLPAVGVDAEVTDAQLEMTDFRVSRISRIDGALAHELGKGLRDILEEKIEEKQQNMVEKINRQIDKNEDRLRLSGGDALDAGWDAVKGWLP